MNVLEIPGVIEAIERECMIRDAAFLPVLEHINGYPAVPMTLIQYHALSLARSPMIPPFRVTRASELTAFLWIINPNYCQDESARGQFIEQCRDLFPPEVPRIRCRPFMRRWGQRFLHSTGHFSRTLLAAREYMNETLMDKPAGEMCVGYIPSFLSDIAQIVGWLAREYGGGPDIYKQMPLKVIFQLLNQIKTWRTPPNQLILFNPLSERAMNSYFSRS